MDAEYAKAGKRESHGTIEEKEGDEEEGFEVVSNPMRRDSTANESVRTDEDENETLLAGA